MEFNLYFYPLLLALGIVTTISDIRSSKIRNKHLLLACGAGVLIYLFLIFSRNFIVSAKLTASLALSIPVAYLLYLTRTWGAGDAKLFMVYALLIPASRYSNLFVFPSLALFVNIILVSTIGILFISAGSLFKNRRMLYDVKIAKEFSLYLIRSFLTLYALTWIIEPIISRLSLEGMVVIILLYYLAYFLIFALVNMIERFKLILGLLFALGFGLRYLFMAESFTLETMTSNLGLALKYAVFFGLLTIMIKRLKPIEKESKTPLALFMFIGAATLNTPFIHWVMKLLYLARR